MSSALVVDSDSEFRALLSSLLHAHGVSVVEAATAREADMVLAERTVDVIVIDALLSDGSGLTWVERLRARDRSVRVVMLTTSGIESTGSSPPVQALERTSIFYKPINAHDLAESLVRVLRVAPPGQTAAAAELGDATTALRELRRQFGARLPGKLAELKRALTELRSDPSLLQQVLTLAHRVRGSAGSYGYAAVGAAAGHIEDLLAELQQAAAVGPHRNLWDELDGAARDAQLAIARTPIPPQPGVERTKNLVRSLLVVDGDPEFLRAARTVGRKRLVEVITAQSANEALAHAQTQSLLGVVLDTRLPGDNAYSLAMRIRATAGNAAIPVAFASSDSSVQTMMAAAHAGGSKLFDKSVASEESLGTLLQELSSLAAPQHGHVLIVDDDPDIVAHYTHHLRLAGMTVSSLDSVEHLLENLEESRADVLLLDLNLPGISGVEMCRALRMLSQWQLLPILIVTAQTDERTRLECFRAGASDVVAKPVLPEELLARVTTQLDRARLMREHSERDALSGLLLRRAFIESLNRAMAICARRSESLAIALIDLDHFKQINDTHGHLAGDEVIARMGELMRRRFRVEDLRGRWGGEEFILAFQDADAHFAERSTRQLLEELSQIRFLSENQQPFSVTFTAGIACYPEDGTSLSALVARADQCLYRGKDQGRNRVCMAQPRRPIEALEPTVEGPKRVLVIDDEDDIRKIAKMSLEKVGGLSVSVAISAREGIALARLDPPDVILLDMMMPEMDGFSALAILQKTPSLSHIPVIFMTARVQPHEVAHYLRGGATGVVPKPFDPVTLPAQILRILENRALQ